MGSGSAQQDSRQVEGSDPFIREATMATKKATRVRNVTPDKVDLRDRPYLPSVAVVPPPAFRVKTRVAVTDQGQTSACTGFGLAAVVGHLLRIAERPKEAEV